MIAGVLGRPAPEGKLDGHWHPPAAAGYPGSSDSASVPPEWVLICSGKRPLFLPPHFRGWKGAWSQAACHVCMKPPGVLLSDGSVHEGGPPVGLRASSRAPSCGCGRHPPQHL